MSDSEFDDKGKRWITDFLKKTEDPIFLLQAIELIGGDIKKIPNVNWGSVQVLHKSVEDFYKYKCSPDLFLKFLYSVLPSSVT